MVRLHCTKHDRGFEPGGQRCPQTRLRVWRCEECVEEARVIVLIAQSQSRSVMGVADFETSKQDTLEYIASMVKRDGVEWKYELENEGPQG